MSWITASIIAAIASLIGGFIAAIWKFGENSGRIKERNDRLEGEIKHAKQANKIQVQPDVSGSEFIAELRAKYDK